MTRTLINYNKLAIKAAIVKKSLDFADALSFDILGFKAWNVELGGESLYFFGKLGNVLGLGEAVLELFEFFA
jgi:hypothetical protein